MNNTLNTSLKLTLTEVQELGDRHYKQAMRHVKRFNDYEEKRKNKKAITEVLDEECTFQPQSFTKKYKLQNKRDNKNPQKTMLQWYRKKKDKLLERTVNRSVEIQKQTRAIVEISGSVQKTPANKNKQQDRSNKNNQSFATSYNIKQMGYYTKKAMRSGNLSTVCPTCHQSSRNNLKSQSELYA